MSKHRITPLYTCVQTTAYVHVQVEMICLAQMNEEEIQEEKSRLSLYLLKSAGACVHIHCESV